MAVNWNMLMAYPNAGQAFAQSFQQGMEQGRQDTARNAMAALVQDPNNPRALAALAKVDPQAAMQFRQQQMEQLKAGLAQHQENILKGAEIIRQFQPKDQQTYSAALQAAQQAGIDISQVPQQFDPAYVDGVVKLADALKPQSGNDPRFIPFQQGGGVVRVNPDGTTAMVIAPNPGDQTPGAPVNNGQPLTDEQMRQLMNGGQTAPAPSGGFR